MVEIAQADRDPRATDLAARAARLALPAPGLTAADLVEAARVDRDPRTSELATLAARFAQPEQSLTNADLIEIARADRDPRAAELAERAALLAQPVQSLTPADLVEVARADHDPRAAELAARAARLFQLDRREMRAANVLAQSFEPPPAPASVAPALLRAQRADEAATLARASEHEAQIALDQHQTRRRPGRLIGWLTGARARYDAELRAAQDMAEMRASQCQRAEVAAVIARKSARGLTQQHERATTTARDADARRREQARAQLRWCADARIALRDFPHIAAKNIHEAIEEVRRNRDRLEAIRYNQNNRTTMVPR